ncbi:MAG TPA: FAD-dependent oxidoreductase [Candidatus Saccharimonadales bacterium]|nr:FAD-dependent oxidoreductase [Candidatus Saccharimonadales bacterium]
MSETHKTRVLIVGGGFGGVKAALELSKHREFEITLLSDEPNFSYHPTLFHTATGGSRAQSLIPLRTIFENKSVLLVRGRAVKIDRKKQFVVTDDGHHYEYDKLILALGSVTNYFGIKGLAEFSYGTKSIHEVERLKAHLHQQLTDTHKADLNYVIVGGGPTGIELAGALPGYLRKIMRAHGIRGHKFHIDLVEGAPRLSPRLPESMSYAIGRRLKRLGIRLYLGKPVQAETADNLMVGGKPIQSHTVIWTAGMTNHPFFHDNNFALNPRGKVVIDHYLQTEPGIYVIGDNADTPFSGMAQTALHDAKFVAENLVRHVHGHAQQTYVPKKPIYVTPAGPHWAAVWWGNLKLYGWIGWLMRSFADLAGYHDLEPWWRAGAQWATELEHEESCPVCASANLK